jgi:DNA integrity scanning protein DisA with diadenylate cyclase activity
MLSFNSKYFSLALLLLITEVIIATWLHDSFIRPFGGDFLVVILIYCMAKSFIDTPVSPTILGVLLFAYLVEISQYFHLVNLLGLERSTTARIIMGTSFSWTDMLMYTLGMLLVLIIELWRMRKYEILCR